jgi:hypothetical protein
MRAASPSGDQLGCRALLVSPGVMFVRPVPFALTTKTSPPFENTNLVPSGDHSGSSTCTCASGITLRRPLPSVLITNRRL